MANVALTAAVRDSLLSLQNTTKLIETTQSRLSTGLKVSGPVDDPVAYFQAKGLNDRAFDFTEKKSSIEQGISTVSAALDGVNAIESLVRQMKGLVNSMKAATSSQFADLVTQFNDLRTQINNQAADVSYQGSNLINGTGVTLTVEFSNDTASRLTVSSIDLTVATAGLDIKNQVSLNTGTLDSVSFSAAEYAGTAGNAAKLVGMSAGSTITLTWNAGTTTFNSASGDLTFTYGGQALTVRASGDQVLSASETFNVTIATGYGTDAFTVVANDEVSFGVSYAASGATNSAWSQGETLTVTYTGPTFTYTTANTTGIGFSYEGQTINLAVVSGTTVSLSAGQTFSIQLQTTTTAGTTATMMAIGGTGLEFITAATSAGSDAGNLGLVLTGTAEQDNSANNYLNLNDSETMNALLQELDSNLATLRTQAQKLGSNVALLQTRLDFTESYVNTLTAGAGKLTLADLNEEGANLLALQTRQQLGIQALSFAGQAEQSILGLFR